MNVSGLYTALSGMNAQKRILDVTAHNVANVTTPGYHRQRVTLEPAGVASVSAIFAGRNLGAGGVSVVSVDRVLDDLAESRLLRETAMQGQTSLTSTTLDRIEQAFPEPSDIGIAAQLDDFWAGWSDLSTNPGDLANRTQLLERSQTVIDALRRASVELDGLEDSSKESVVRLATDINDIAGRIAELNRNVVGSDGGANDLLDQRDELVMKLAELSGAVTRPAGGGQIDVYIGGRIIVSGSTTQSINGTGGQLTWASDGAAVTAPPSRAAALAETINDTVPRYRASLDAVAQSLVTSVNTLHTTGYDLTGPPGATGRNFFDPAGVTAATISLSTDVAGQPDRIAAGAPGPGVPGRLDGELARAMAGLASGPAGPDALYRSMVSTLGVEVRTAIRRDEIQGQLVQAAANRADSVGGVSIDEEMANMMSAQRAFEASARVLTAVDEMMGVLLRTGVVGR